LNRPSLNPIQLYALQYWLIMERRGAVEDADRALEAHCSVMWPERWDQIYNKASVNAAQGMADDEVPVTDAADLDRWFEGLANQRGMTGAEAEQFFDPSIFGVAQGEGIRV
jgi:hypothetical protein